MLMHIVTLGMDAIALLASCACVVCTLYTNMNKMPMQQMNMCVLGCLACSGISIYQQPFHLTLVAKLANYSL